MKAKVAIIYLSFHADDYLPDFISALKNLTYSRERLLVVVVDNPHPKFGSSVRAIEMAMIPLSGKEIPEIVILPQKENLGFDGGNNAGARYAIAHGAEYIFFHNDDGFLAPGALEPLVAAMDEDATVALAQSLMILYPETEYVNSAGNSFHYLGFGYCNEYRTLAGQLKDSRVHDISYASGAAVMMRADFLRAHGFWDEDFFMYHEDIEISLRLRSRGYRVVLVPSSIFYHKYQFSRSIKKFYWMERNRYAVLLMYYKVPTIFLLLPMIAIVEAGLLIMSVIRGWWRERLHVYVYWGKPGNWNRWLAKRAEMQKKRTVGDRALLEYTVPTIIFQESSVQHPVLSHIVNPIMRVYWRCILWAVRW